MTVWVNDIPFWWRIQLVYLAFFLFIDDIYRIPRKEEIPEKKESKSRNSKRSDGVSEEEYSIKMGLFSSLSQTYREVTSNMPLHFFKLDELMPEKL